MPLYRQTDSDGYEETWSGDRYEKTHRLVSGYLGFPRERGRVIHHKDFDKRNNAPWNLESMNFFEHRQLHQIALQAHGLTEYAKSGKGRAKSSELMHKLWADPVWRAKMLKKVRPWEKVKNYRGWFTTPEGREFSRLRMEQFNKEHPRWAKQRNHKVVHIEAGKTEDVFDLLNVTPTNNFAANGVYVHNSMWMLNDYNANDVALDDTWGTGPRRVTWRAMAAYMDEAHLVIDSVNAWRKKTTSAKTKKALGNVADAVNAVSSIPIQL
jgi:hypothetical protein